MTDSKRSTRNLSPNKQKLGPYILLEKLGRGSFGVVWKAIEKGNVAARPVALKLAQDENEDLYEIIREARLWVKASGHPNVLPIIKAFLHNKRIVIVSEYAQDGPLDRWLKKHGGKAPSIQAAIKMLDGILSGLRYLHTATPDKPQIVHRDLKPSNILLQGEIPRIADFGLAREIKDSQSGNSIAGTQLYMAPEAFTGQRTVKTDIWSVGVIFYLLLTGNPPFKHVPDIMQSDPLPIPETIPEPLRLFIYRALKKRPEERYNSTAEMQADLNSIYSMVTTRAEVKIEDLQSPPWPPASILPPSYEELSESIIISDFENEFIQPFGEICCEDELRILKTNYNEYYFNHTPFNKEAMASNTYLIVGRRGSGKSSLASYFRFQNAIKNSRCIDVDGPEIYEQVLSQITSSVTGTPEIAIPRIVKIWEFVIWSLVFQEYRDKNSKIAAACMLGQQKMGPANFVREILNRILTTIKGDRRQLTDRLEDLINSDQIRSAREAVLELVQREPIIIAIDSLEHFSINDEAMMRAIAALIQCAKQFNDTTARRGIHVKVFITEEAFPHIPEAIIGNPLKHIRNTIYLHWRPKDLISLICWRLYLYLNYYNRLLPESRDKIDWSKFSMVRQKMWAPYFGEELINTSGSAEKTFPYVLRHTQMRPRQLIHLCNEVARRSKQKRTFPKFLPETIIETINDNVLELSTEVINAYSTTYPNTARILTALVGQPNKFKGRELDRIAPRTASEWPAGEYSPLKFRELVAELGIVGRIRGSSSKTEIVKADFEYNLKDRLNLQVDDDCVIHPMFYEKLNTDFVHPIHVYPFPDHQDFAEIY